MENIKYIEIYGKVTCGYCAKAVDFLKAAGVEFMLSLVDQAPTRHAEIKKVTGYVTVPLILLHSKDGGLRLIGGYDNMVSFFRTEYGVVFKDSPKISIDTDEPLGEPIEVDDALLEQCAGEE